MRSVAAAWRSAAAHGRRRPAQRHPAASSSIWHGGSHHAARHPVAHVDSEHEETNAARAWRRASASPTDVPPLPLAFGARHALAGRGLWLQSGDGGGGGGVPMRFFSGGGSSSSSSKGGGGGGGGGKRTGSSKPGEQFGRRRVKNAASTFLGSSESRLRGKPRTTTHIVTTAASPALPPSPTHPTPTTPLTSVRRGERRRSVVDEL